MIYQFKITLKQMASPVWRRIQVDEQTSFGKLHLLIQAAFEWDDMHLHEFYLKTTMEKTSFFEEDNIRIGSIEEDDIVFGFSLDESQEIVGDYFKQEKDKAVYIYDFGDDWRHEIVLENILYPEQDVLYPLCLKAKGAAPEEDSRGMWEWEDEEADLPTPPDEKALVNDINRLFESFLEEPVISEEVMSEQKSWEALFSAAESYKNTKLWQFLADDQIIIVELPGTKERAYCSILGNAEQEYGIAAYLGDAGLTSLLKLVSNPAQYGMNEVLKQRSLLASFVNREELEEDDYLLIKKLGLSFRGKKQWPMFRSIEPGYHPWVINEQEALLLRNILEVFIEKAAELKENRHEIPIVTDKKWLTFSPAGEGGAASWESKWTKPKLREKNKDPVSLLVSELEIKRMQKQFPLVQAIFEFEGHYFPEPVQDHEAERPHYPTMVLAADHQHGKILYYDFLQIEEYEKKVQATFLKMVEQTEAIPAEIRVENETTLRILRPLCKALSVQVIQVEQLPIITDFYQEMKGSMHHFSR